MFSLSVASETLIFLAFLILRGTFFPNARNVFSVLKRFHLRVNAITTVCHYIFYNTQSFVFTQ